jgi:hypothetical protein
MVDNCENPLNAKTQRKATIIAVLPAIIRLKSFSDREIKLVSANPAAKVTTTGSETAKWSRVTANIPAITSVQECKRLETGVGPSIASGSQRLKINVTDFKEEAAIRRVDTEELIPAVAIEPESDEIASIRKRSPILLNPMAEKAPPTVEFRSAQNPIRRNEIKPTHSQAKSHRKRSPAETTSQTEKRNRVNFRLKSVKCLSNSMYEAKIHSPVIEEAKNHTKMFQDENSNTLKLPNSATELPGVRSCSPENESAVLGQLRTEIKAIEAEISTVVIAEID